MALPLHRALGTTPVKRVNATAQTPTLSASSVSRGSAWSPQHAPSKVNPLSQAFEKLGNQTSALLSRLMHTDGVNPPQKYDADVIVVGAGWAGLTTAKHLNEAGHSTLVLEAAPHVGGRIRTDDTTFSVPFDDGAAWIHSFRDDAGRSSNPLTEPTVKAGITLHETSLGNTLYIDGRAATDQELQLYQQTVETYEGALEQAAATHHDVAGGALLDPNLPFAAAAKANLGELDMGQSLDKVSAVDVGGQKMNHHDALPKGGQLKVLQAVVGDVPVQTDTPVKKIKWGSAGVEVTTSTNQKLNARRIVLTVSTGVLNSGKIEFDPPLPAWKRDAIRALPMNVFNKVAIEFNSEDALRLPDGRLAPENDWVIHTSSDGSPPMGFLMRPSGANIAVGFVAGDQALRLEKAGPAAAVEYAMNKLRPVFGPQIDGLVARTKVTEWGKDPLTLGSYSYASPGMAHMREKLALPVSDRLFFAGEATAPTADAQMIHGAYGSGIEAAKRVRQSLAADDASEQTAHRAQRRLSR
jgi:monoamine oxidase